MGIGADRQVVRFFPDYADTVLWFQGPVPYDASGLSAELVRDLEVWERFYYEALGPDQEWKSPELASRFTVRGDHLAARVAKELGRRYEVEFQSYEPDVPVHRFRATGPADNVRAAARFDELAQSISAQEQEWVTSVDDHGDTGQGWFAIAGVSGTVYKPG
ncbi:hypothetical protein [Nesterenkonia massiliensis]|uniref:hypothetical protein n=1 Tax=Nesterenkonia massiliensis TaxID=1232429 RepID=UPI00040C39F0|nr:hypothetical protein [Nesterenkonia massiliensis]